MNRLGVCACVCFVDFLTFYAFVNLLAQCVQVDACINVFAAFVVLLALMLNLCVHSTVHGVLRAFMRLFPYFRTK